MPLYEHRCPACGHTETEYRPMTQHAEAPTCPTCLTPMPRDFANEAAGPHTEREFAVPIEMHSIALTHPEDIEAFQRRNPGAEIGTDPARDDYGVPRARSRAEKLRILKTEGFEERN